MGKSRWFWLILLAAFAVAWWRPGRAEDWAELRWSHPTTLTNGLPLMLTDIQGTDVEYGPCPLVPATARTISLAGIQTRTMLQRLTPGAWCFRLYTRAAQGRSQASATVQKLIPAAGCGNGCHLK